MKRVIALGFFDGVHLGHQALLNRTTERARALGAVSAACTFDVHPESVIFHQEMKLLSTPAERALLMKELCGVEEVITARFDETMMTMPWDTFVRDYLVGELGAVHVVAGHDYHFGYRGEGNPDRLRALCQELGVGCDIVGKVSLDGITVSSTYIRTLIAQGELEGACRYLGHPHLMEGEVRHGKRLGRSLGFPTVNLIPQPGILVPAYGVYVSRVTLEDGAQFPAATNIGVRPTIQDGNAVTVEGFMLDFDGDLYGQTLKMEFFHRLRGEKTFDSLEALTAEVMKNAEETRAYLRQYETNNI